MSGAPPLPASTPSRAAGLLGLVRKLIDYGTFLAGTLRQRGLGDHPIVHGLQFGTTNITLILARIARGLLRAAALEALLNRDAARLDAPPPPRAAQARQPSAARSAVGPPRATRPAPVAPTMLRCSRRCPRPSRLPPRSAAARSAR
jgi:hypothetical protein